MLTHNLVRAFGGGWRCVNCESGGPTIAVANKTACSNPSTDQVIQAVEGAGKFAEPSDAARALLASAAATIREHLDTLPKCDRHGCRRPASRYWMHDCMSWCEEHVPSALITYGARADYELVVYKTAPTVRALTALLAEIDASA